MFLEISAFEEFYASPLGAATSVAIRTGLSEVWPESRDQHGLGIGYAFPYLEIFGNEAASAAAITPARLGVRAWGQGKGNCTAMAGLQALPLANAAYDRILMIHALDFTRDRELFLESASAAIVCLDPDTVAALCLEVEVGVGPQLVS